MVKLSLIKSVDNLLPKRNSPSIGIKHGPVCPFYADVLFTLCDLLVRHKGLPVGAETRTFNILNQPFQKFPRDGTENVMKMGHIKVNGYTFKGSNSYILPRFHWRQLLILLHSERPKLHTILAFQDAIGLKGLKAKIASLERILSLKVDPIYSGWTSLPRKANRKGLGEMRR